MLTKEEKKAALYSISFNRTKALSLFLFCLASFCLGITVWYWQQDRAYGQKIESYKQELLQTMTEQINDHNFTAQSDLHEGVVAVQGVMDFDEVWYLNDKPNLYEKKQDTMAVHGQKRQIALGVYEIRFVPTKDGAADQNAAGSTDAANKAN